MLDLIDILVASGFATIVVCVLMVMVHVAEREQGVLVNIARITRSCSNHPNTSTPPNPEYPL